MHQHRKVNYLFPGIDAATRAKLKLDDVAMYSVTDQRTADAISRRILRFAPPSAHVTNATACVGGNTWSFAKHFDHVTAVEHDPTRYQYLVHNLGVLAVRNVTPIMGDALNVLFSRKRTKAAANVVFIDPPWGGPDYKLATRLSLSLSGVPMSSILDKLADTAHVIAIKVPVNFDTEALVRDTRRVELASIDKFKRMHLLVFIPRRPKSQQGPRRTTRLTTTTARDQAFRRNAPVPPPGPGGRAIAEAPGAGPSGPGG